MLSEIKKRSSYLAEEDNETDKNLFKKHARIGWPLGEDKYIEYLEELAGRDLKKKKLGVRRDN